ncbi:hypothetical protein RDI58_026711 [Solanum bulbocastanum]|uniref:Uncharacterized protein n=1 Tax=Solanum bulbocastanum TaxID=147425 RepID=A0AAN8SVV5_SOLBU
MMFPVGAVFVHTANPILKIKFLTQLSDSFPSKYKYLPGIALFPVQ